MTTQAAQDALGTHGPKNLSHLFWVMSLLALRGFGGVLPWAQRVLVEEEHWLSKDDFLELLAYGQVLPGPNVCNLAIMVGDRFFGARGAMVAMAGMLCFPLVVVLLLAWAYGQFAYIAWVQNALSGMASVAAGLIIAMGVKLAVGLGRRWPWLVISGATLLGLLLFRFSVIWVLIVIAPISVLTAWYIHVRGSAP